ncbi:MAG: hypothetical protein GY753_09745 [Gammaproteobacteria bacterium]|nr:hypothetical protein [Gammaproteobacteria bacterium]
MSVFIGAIGTSTPRTTTQTAHLRLGLGSRRKESRDEETAGAIESWLGGNYPD